MKDETNYGYPYDHSFTFVSSLIRKHPFEEKGKYLMPIHDHLIKDPLRCFLRLFPFNIQGYTRIRFPGIRFNPVTSVKWFCLSLTHSKAPSWQITTRCFTKCSLISNRDLVLRKIPEHPPFGGCACLGRMVGWGLLVIWLPFGPTSRSREGV